MFDFQFIKHLGRKTIVTGHYGSGKTEFSVSLSLLLATQLEVCQKNRPPDTEMCQKNRPPDTLAVIDLDVINPYFRSREQRELLEKSGIAVYGSAFDTEVTAELPALSASLRAPLESKTCRVIIDTGGNDAGAVVLNQFTKYFTDDDTTVLAVINANRPDTGSVKSAIEHLTAIEQITNLNITAIVNNTHMLRETTVADIVEGHEFCEEICEITGKFLLCDCYPEGIVNPDELKGVLKNLMPLGLYMRPTWLDK